MEPKLNARYLEIRADLARLPAQAERGWLIDQAAAAQPRRSGAFSIRHLVGAALISIGERVQGTAGPVLATIGPDRHPASIQDA